MSSNVASFKPLLYAGIFMLVGILTLIWIASDHPRILDAPLTELNLAPLVSAQDSPTVESLKGKVVVLHFWGTWCPPCRLEYPEFAKLYKEFASDENVRIVSVSCSPGAEDDLKSLANDTQEYLASIDANMPVYADPTSFTRSQVAAQLPSGLAYPTTLVVDQNGIVRKAWVGADVMAMQKLVSEIREMLAHPPAQANRA